MQNEMCELIVNVYVYSFFDHCVDIVLKRDSLDRIDAFTNRYKDPQALFKDNRDSIVAKATYEFEKKHGYSPTSMELGEEGIYILKSGNKISPLFETISGYKLEDWLVKRMIEGSLQAFYQCDKRRMDDEYTYESFFADFDRKSKERIERGEITSQDIMYALSTVMLSPRMYPTIRFLLRKVDKYDFKELYQMFCSTIPDMETVKTPVNEQRTSETSQERVYRYPYNDDN